MKRMALIFLTMSGLALAHAGVAAAPAAPEVWIKGGVPLSNIPPAWKGIREDAGASWEPDAPWPAVRGRVKVAEVAPGAIQWAKDEELREAFAGMQRAHIMLALGTGLLTRSDHCQAHNEASAAPGELEQMLTKIRRNGGDLRYIAMDEPYYYGHKDGSGCHLPAAELAADVARNVAAARRIFPQVKVGDAEVVGASIPFIRELAVWADAYRAATGERLDFMQTDIAWTELAMRNLKPLSEELHTRGIPLAIIYNADAEARTDESWQQSAENHIADIEGLLDIHPDIAVFDSWTPNPRRYLPETSPGTLTNIALRYFRPRTLLTMDNQSGHVTGRLTDSQGKGIAGAKVDLEAVDVGGRLGPLPRRLEGTVPQGATTGVIGIRVGIEGACVCAGPAGAIVGGIHYKEKIAGKTPQDVSAISLPIQGAPPGVRTLALVPGQTFAPNLKQFPVTSGASYTLDTTVAATAAAEHGGYVTLVFLNASGKGLRRDFIWLTPSVVTLGTAQTAADGVFHAALPATVELGRPEIRARYSGNDDHRSASAVAPSSLESVNATLPALEPALFGSRSPLTMLFMRSDFAAMFSEPTLNPQAKKEWDSVASRIQVAYFSAGGILKMPDDELARMVLDLKSRRIGLGLEILATNWFHERPCGQGIEGFIDPGSANQVVAKLLRAGASVEQVGMDEPLWFGHFYRGKNACQSSISELANRVAVIVKIYTSAFPHVVVGDVEPFPAISKQQNWQTVYANWVKTFDSTVGTPLNFLRLDFNWGDESLSSDGKHNVPDPAKIAKLARLILPIARQNGLLSDMILNGGGAPVAQTDAAWMEQARMHVRALQAPGIRFDHVLFESWDRFPTRTLPDSDSNALSSLLVARP